MKSLETVEFPPNHPELFPDWSESPDLLPGSLQALCLEAKRGSIGAELVALALRRMGERRRRWGADESNSWAARSCGEMSILGGPSGLHGLLSFGVLSFVECWFRNFGVYLQEKHEESEECQEVALVLLCKCSLEVG